MTNSQRTTEIKRLVLKAKNDNRQDICWCIDYNDRGAFKRFEQVGIRLDQIAELVADHADAIASQGDPPDNPVRNLAAQRSLTDRKFITIYEEKKP